jgi:putative Mn2+ efflux pump MntP
MLGEFYSLEKNIHFYVLAIIMSVDSVAMAMRRKIPKHVPKFKH